MRNIGAGEARGERRIARPGPIRETGGRDRAFRRTASLRMAGCGG